MLKMDQNREPNERVRSLNSNTKCYVRFINTTDKTVDLLWINFTGLYVRYGILRRGDYIDVTTYKTHPWIAKDIITKDMLHIDGKYFYQPRTTEEILNERFPHRQIPESYETRVRAYIGNPLYSLRYASLLVLRNHLLDETDVEQLQLPNQLSSDLKKAITMRKREHSLQILGR